MSLDIARRGVHISSGRGIVAHLDGLTAFAFGDDTELNNLLVRLNALAGEPWQEIVRTLTAEITAVGYDAHPSLACVSLEEDAVAALVFGDTTLTLVIDGHEMSLNGTGSSTWVDVVLHGKIDRISGGTPPDTAVVGVLRDGVVPAGGFILDSDGPIPASGRWSEEFAAPVISPADEVATNDSVIEADLPEDEPSVDSLPAPAVAQDTDPQDEQIVGAPELGEPISSDVDAELPAEDHDLVPVESPDMTEAAVEDHDPLSAEPEWADPDASAPPASGLFARLDERINGDDHMIHDDSLEEIPEPIGSVELDPPVEPLPSPDPVEEALEVRTVPAEQDDPNMRSMAATIAQTAPQIRGVRCEAGHLTKPGGAPCMTCGMSIAAGATEEVGNRPALGTLTFDDGAALNIDRPAAIGADVPTGYNVSNEPATIVRLDDGAGGIDGVHLEVQLSGWDVNIVDMQTSTGTYTMLEGDRQTRTRLRSGQSVALQPGMQVEAGGRSFTYTVGPNPPVE